MHTATAGSTRATSSMARIDAKNDEPAPPYAGATAMPISPSGKSSAMRAGAKRASRSISATSGLMRRSAKSRTVWRKSASSSESAGGGAGAGMGGLLADQLPADKP